MEPPGPLMDSPWSQLHQAPLDHIFRSLCSFSPWDSSVLPLFDPAQITHRLYVTIREMVVVLKAPGQSWPAYGLSIRDGDR